MSRIIEISDELYGGMLRNAEKRGVSMDEYIDTMLRTAARPIYSSIAELDESLGVSPEESARAVVEAAERLKEEGIEVDENDADLQHARRVLAGIQQTHASAEADVS